MARAWFFALAAVGCTSGDPEPAARVDSGSLVDSAVPDTGRPGEDAPFDARTDPPPPEASVEGGSHADAAAPLSARVQRYDFTVDLRDGAASSSVVFEVSGGAGCAELRSRVPLEGLRASGGEGLTVTQDGQVVSLCTPGPLRALSLESRQTIPLSAEPRTGVGFSRRPDPDGNPFAYLLGWVEACDRFGPCDPSPALLSHFTFDVHHAEGDVVVCPGRLTRGTTSTHCELLDTRAPTYSSFAVASNSAWQPLPLVSAAGVSVVVYDTPRASLRNALDGAAIGAFIEWVSRVLGPFPYGDELRLVAGPVEWSGMEHPANIVLRHDLATVQSRYENLPLHAALHEIAHQWAGDRTTIESALDFGWKEGIAEYLAYVFEEESRPAAESRATRKAWHSIGLSAPFYLRPTEEPSLPLSDWTLGVYGTGPMTLFVQLEHWLGRPKIVEAIRRFLAEPVAQGTSALKSALESASGRDLTTYFDAWVFGRGEPKWAELTVATSSANGEVTVTVTQDASRVFPCVVEVDVTSVTGTRRVVVDFGLEPAQRAASVTFPSSEAITALRLDPDARLLAYPPAASALSQPEARSFRFHP